MGSSNSGDGEKPDRAVDGKIDSIYTEAEKVLAYHGPCLYEAKVQKVESGKKERKYFVHYTGWNKSWDEWVGSDRLLKFTEENVQKQKALNKAQAGDKSLKSGRSSHSKPKGLTDAKIEKEDVKNSGPRGKKRKANSGLENKDSRSTDKTVPIQLPLAIKKQLIDDWEYVTQLGKLVKIPRTPNVDDVLKKYLDYRAKKDGMLVSERYHLSRPVAFLYGLYGNWVSESLGEILKGIRCYFDKALPLSLLYKKERQQYQETVVDNASPSTIYGAEHLLRLFVKLPELLVCINMEEEALAKLQNNLLDFLKFLQKNQSSFFLSTYDGSKEPEEST